MTRGHLLYCLAIRDALDVLYPPGREADDNPNDAERARRLETARARLDIARRQIRQLVQAQTYALPQVRATAACPWCAWAARISGDDAREVAVFLRARLVEHGLTVHSTMVEPLVSMDGDTIVLGKAP